jgi:pilus assembly protein Flp/PilA
MMNTLAHLMLQLKNDRRGVTALEYGLIASLIAVFLIGALTSLGNGLSTTFTTIATRI